MNLVNPFTSFPSGGGGGAPALIANILGAQGANGGTTSAIDTTGANFIAFAVAYYAPLGSPSVSDSKSNTWFARTAYSDGVFGIQIFYCYSATTGSGHTFTTSGTGIYCTGMVAAFSNIASNPYDAENGTNGAEPISTGSVTPSQNSVLFITSVGSAGSSLSVNNGFVITDQIANSPGFYVQGGMAYKIITDGAATSATWTGTNGQDGAAIASFKY